MRGSSVGVPKLFELLIVLYVFHTTIPVFGYYVPASVHAAVVLVLYALLAVYDRFFIQNFIRSLPLVGISFLAIVYSGFSGFTVHFYVLLQLFLFPLLALYLMRYGETKTLKRMLILIGLSYLVTSITTYIGNQVYPSASRNLAAVFQSDEAYMFDVYTKMNIGGFNFIYALVLLTPIVIYMTRTQKIPLGIGAILLIVISATVFVSEYTTAFLSLLLTVVALFLIRKSFGRKQIFTLLLFVIVLVIVFDSMLPDLAHLSDLFGSEQISSRLNELNELSMGQTNYDGDLGSRYELYQMSLLSFAQSPLWGSSTAVVGGHSFFFDTMAKYGLVGIFALFFMYRQLYSLFYKPSKGSDVYGYALFALGLAIVLAILNPKDNLSVLSFTIPVAASFFTKQQ